MPKKLYLKEEKKKIVFSIARRFTKSFITFGFQTNLRVRESSAKMPKQSGEFIGPHNLLRLK